MKKAERIVSYLLVLALVTSLLTGLGYAKSDTVDAKAAGNTLNVLVLLVRQPLPAQIISKRRY